jgi:CheY-like chemotaxis protein
MATLFILDDDPIFHRLIEIALTKSNPYKYIHHYYEARPLINYITENKDDPSNLPDAIFVDISLPIVDGWSFLDELEKTYHTLSKKIVINVVTVSVRKQDMIRAQNYSIVSEYIIKPMPTTKLMDIAHKINTELQKKL